MKTAPLLAAYGVERLVKEIPRKASVPTSRLSAYDNVLDPRSDLNQLSSYIEYLDAQRLDALSADESLKTNADAQQLQSIFDSCNSILEPTGWGNARWDRKAKSVVLTHKQHGTLPLSLMATGTKICAGLALDIATRMGRLNPHLSGEELRCQTPGIVLIDEVDMHLHPSWQRKILPTLLETFPAVQFIVTTHSPLVIANAETASVRALVDNEVHTPEYAQGLDIETVIERVQGWILHRIQRTAGCSPPIWRWFTPDKAIAKKPLDCADGLRNPSAASTLYQNYWKQMRICFLKVTVRGNRQCLFSAVRTTKKNSSCAQSFNVRFVKG